MTKARDGRSIVVLHPYERLKNAIMGGDLPPGTQLVETTLARTYEVSRTPIREALTRLQHDGLVERGTQGLVVRDRSSEEIIDLYEARLVLEGAAAEMAARERTSRDLALLHRLLERDVEAKTPAPAVMARWNVEFHRAIWSATRNSWIVDLLERLQMHLAQYPATTLSSPGRWEESLREHAELLEAIGAGDAERAKAVSAAHFMAARDIRVRLWLDEFREDTP